MDWISIKDKKPLENKYYLVCSSCGWIGIRQYRNGLWCDTEFPNVICDDIIYDVRNEDILYYIATWDIPMPNQPEGNKREGSISQV